MSYTHRIFIATLFFFSTVTITAQTVTTPDLNKSLIPPSPDAASLGKYGVLPVTLYSGMVDVSVPLTEMKSAKLSLPLSLSYNNNGYRPGEESSWVGLGWTLQAGGVITRVVKGRADDDNSLYHWGQFANIQDMTNNQDYMSWISSRQVDTEPDIYIFNFNGHSGKFIMVGNRAYMLTHQDLKISQYGAGFLIVAEDGVSYYFLDSELTTSPNSTNPGLYTPPYTSAWYLTKMISADLTDEIDFKYTAFSHRQSNAMSQESYTIQRGGQGSLNNTCSWINGHCDTWTNTPYTGALITAKRVTGISCRSGYINFIPESTIRQDFNSVGEYALQEIDVYNLPDSTLTKKINLKHGYFYGDNGGQNGATQLRLDTVSIKGYTYNNNILNHPPPDSVTLPAYYTFQYNNPAGNLPKGTRAIDRWGYFNGAGNAILFDSSISADPLVYPAANRNVNTQYSVNGTLARMTYPTGGYTQFTYGPNAYKDPGTVRQLQTKQAYTQVLYDSRYNPTIGGGNFSLDHDQIVNLAFGRVIIPADTPNGVLNVTPILNIYSLPPGCCDSVGGPKPVLVYTCPHLNKALSDGIASISLTAGNYSYSVSCESTSTSSYVNITYADTVATTFPGQPGPGLRIQSVRSYDNLNNAVPALTKTYIYPGPIQLLYGDFYDYYSVTHSMYTQDIFSSSSSSPLSTLLGNQYYYPTVIETDSGTTGTGKTTYTYNGSGSDAMGIYLLTQTDSAAKNGSFIPVRQKVNNWSHVNLINFWSFTYHISQMSEYATLPLTSPMPFDTINRYILYSTPSYVISSDYNSLQATDETAYDQNGQNPLTIHTDYYYDNPNYLQHSRAVTLNSKGDTIITRTKYPLDYSYVSCGSLYSIDTTFKSARDAVHITYGQCVSNRYQAANNAWDKTTPITSDPAVMNALRSYPCEVNYPPNTTTVVNTMNNSITNYYGCLNTNLLPDAQLGITRMQLYNIRTIPVEQIVSIKKQGGSENLYGAVKTDFTVSPKWSVSPKILYETPFSSSPILLSDFLASSGNYYQSRVNFKYDILDNIIEQSKTNDLKMAYIWDYKSMYPIAQVINADTGSIAYTSFESDGTGNWTVPAGGNTANMPGITGSRCYLFSTGAISRAGLDSTRTYTLSYWLKSGSSASVTGGAAPVTGPTRNGWTLYESTVSKVTTVSISGSGYIDELRLFPSNAQMTTYTYIPLLGVTSACSPTGIITYYEYDGLGRLKLVRDPDGNILKTIDYHYQRQNQGQN